MAGKNLIYFSLHDARMRMSMLCSICSREFSNVSNLKKHLKKFHPDKLNESKKAKEYDCKECGKFFIKPQYLKIHVKKFHSDKVDTLFPKKIYNFKCDQCEKQFSHKFHYNHHLKVHNPSEQKPKNKCPMCTFEHCNTFIVGVYNPIPYL